jgi:S1-C subfamily serine protease
MKIFSMSNFKCQINKKPTLQVPVGILLGILLLFLPPQVLAEIFNRENAIVRAVRKVGPAVVNISSEYTVRKRLNPFTGFGMDQFFDSFFRDFFDPDLEQKSKRTSLGSGVIIDGNKGLIITNAHVIANTGIIKIVLNDEREFEAQIVGADPDFDLAVLRIKSNDPLPAIQMASSSDLMIGETVIAIGNPFGFSHTVTTGVISSLNRSIRTGDRIYHQFIQIDASINPGNSGGPLLNINGELIGINTAIYAKAQGIGFAIPINPRLAQYLNVPGKRGVMVKSVESNSPAQKAGIRESDIMISIGNRNIYSDDDYQTAMRSFAAGDTLDARIWRNGNELSVSVTTQVFPMGLAEKLAIRLLGVKVEDISGKNRRRFGISAQEGVIISELHPKTHLTRIGAEPGDVIRQIDEFSIKNTADFKQAIVKYRHKKSVIILLQRGDQGYYLAVDLG